MTVSQDLQRWDECKTYNVVGKKGWMKALIMGSLTKETDRWKFTAHQEFVKHGNAERNVHVETDRVREFPNYHPILRKCEEILQWKHRSQDVPYYKYPDEKGDSGVKSIESRRSSAIFIRGDGELRTLVICIPSGQFRTG